MGAKGLSKHALRPDDRLTRLTELDRGGATVGLNASRIQSPARIRR